MKKKCCFIVPYFGKLPSYFNLFMKSCSYNTDYNWLIFTDDDTEYNTPNNVNIIRMTFQELNQLIQSKFNFKITLETPYKLCDYKPAYGYIFEEYIKDYLFWGHCDLDLIFGNINKFITKQMLNKYDKIFSLGHLILYRNTFENNRVFMNKYNNVEIYKQAFTNSEIVVFDETCINNVNINTLFEESRKKIFLKDFSMNLKVLPTKFVKTTFIPEKYEFIDEEYKKAIYIWKEGELYRLYKEENKIKKEYFLYMHFQLRKMKLPKKTLKYDYIQIIPNEFLPIKKNREITVKNFRKTRAKRICLHYLKIKYDRFKRRWRKR